MGVHDTPAGHSPDHRAGSRRPLRTAVALVIVAAAALTFAFPLPLRALVAWRHAYAWAQPAITGATGQVPLAVLDVLLVAAGVWVAAAVWRRRRGTMARLLRRIVVGAALAWSSFLVAWGWHYQVPTLEARLAVTPDDVQGAQARRFVMATVEQLNATHAAAHHLPWRSREAMPEVLRPLMAAVLPRVDVRWVPQLPPPKRTLLDWYFRSAGIDGMTNPYGLDVVLNSRVLPIELPALAAHEYAHLAGFADESDATLVAWLVCQSGEAQLRYSAALAVLPHLLSGVPGEVRREATRTLAPGPRGDLDAIAARLAEQRPWIHALAWQTYDRFLRANRVGEGVARYDAVARVLIAAADPATGRLRRSPMPWPPATPR